MNKNNLNERSKILQDRLDKVYEKLSSYKGRPLNTLENNNLENFMEQIQEKMSIKNNLYKFKHNELEYLFDIIKLFYGYILDLNDSNIELNENLEFLEEERNVLEEDNRNLEEENRKLNELKDRLLAEIDYLRRQLDDCLGRRRRQVEIPSRQNRPRNERTQPFLSGKSSRKASKHVSQRGGEKKSKKKH